MAAKVVIVLLTLALAGCQTPWGWGGNPRFCDLAEPMRISDATIGVMTEAEVDQTLMHNEIGARACGWTP